MLQHRHQVFKSTINHRTRATERVPLCVAQRVQLFQPQERSEEHTSELQSLMRISYAVFCLKKKTRRPTYKQTNTTQRSTTHPYTALHIPRSSEAITTYKQHT